jgi:hypothetical protein
MDTIKIQRKEHLKPFEFGKPITILCSCGEEITLKDEQALHNGTIELNKIALCPNCERYWYIRCELLDDEEIQNIKEMLENENI